MYIYLCLKERRIAWVKTIRLIAVLIFLMPSTAFSQIVGSLSGTMPAYINSVGCAPTSVAMVLAYWDIQYNMTNMFPGVTGVNLYTISNIDSRISQIAADCGTDGLGNTPAANVGPGLVTYAGSMGYGFQATLSGSIASGTPHGSQISLTTAWNNLVSDINANEPVLFSVDSNGDGIADHVTPVIGYDSNHNGLGKYYQCILDDSSVAWEKFQSVASGNTFGVGQEIQIVPEPTTMTLLLGGIGLIFLRKKNMYMTFSKNQMSKFIYTQLNVR